MDCGSTPGITDDNGGADIRPTRRGEGAIANGFSMPEWAWEQLSARGWRKFWDVVSGRESFQAENPNCIVSAIRGAKLHPTNNIESDERNGGNVHDGIHVAFGSDTRPVVALPAMAGTVDHAGRQSSDWANADFNFVLIYIILKPLDGQRYVLSLVDLQYKGSPNKKQQIKPGQLIGYANGSDDPRNKESGLHVTLMTYATYQDYIRGRWSYRARRSVPADKLIDAARDENSPFRCLRL